LTSLTCYATLIVVICLNIQASVHLFTSDTNWLVPNGKRCNRIPSDITI